MNTRDSRLPRGLAAFALALAALSAFAGTSQAAEGAAPAWKIGAAVAPTNVPPEQSEVQQVTVEAESGSFMLTTTESGSGTLDIASGRLSLTAGSAVAAIVTGTYPVGQLVKALGIPAGATIVSCSTDCSEPGSTVTLSAAATATKEREVRIYSREVTAVTGDFHIGDQIAGTGIVSGTTVEAVGGGTLTLSEFPTETLVGEPVALTATEATLPIPYNALAEEVGIYLEALPAIGAGAVKVSGGPGGQAGTPYFIAFTGPLAHQNVAQLSGDGSLLEGEKHFANVSTVVQGGPGTGEIAVFPTNVGGASSAGVITVAIGPLPSGILFRGTPSGAGWTCSQTANETTCKTNTVIPPSSPAEPIGVPVQVQAAASPLSRVTVTISGGGASAREISQVPLAVSTEPVPFGIAAFWRALLVPRACLRRRPVGIPTAT